MILSLFIHITPFTEYCCSLTWLDVSHNQLESLSGIQSLVNLSGKDKYVSLDVMATMCSTQCWSQHDKHIRKYFCLER